MYLIDSIPKATRVRLPFKWRITVLSLFAVVGSLALFAFLALYGRPPEAAPSNKPIVWVVSGMERVGQNDPPGSTTGVALYAARGEYEPFQVVIRTPATGLTNIKFSVSELRGPNGHTIPQANITLYREHYVYVSHSSPDLGGSNRPLGPGWYPDALIPFVDPTTQKAPLGATLKAVPFDLTPQTNQPIWVDLFVPHHTWPGQYRGTFTVTSDQGAVEGEILLTVWNFALPIKPSLVSSFQIYGEKTIAKNSELLKHKIMPMNVPAEDQRVLIDTLGLRSVGLGFGSGADVNTCRMSSAPAVADFQTAAVGYQTDLFLYNQTADEIDDCPNLYEPLKAWARNMHKAGIANVVTMTPQPELYDDGSGTGRSTVDIWVLLPKMYDAARTRVAEVLRKGDAVWSYNALVQDKYSPKWEIDFAPINYRIQPGFISQSLGLTGLLYWRVDLWTGDPWTDPQAYNNGQDYFPGEGMLVYPGEKVGIQGFVPSMRLKWLREGVEDYEYIEILKRRGRGDWALGVARQVGADWSNWTRDPNALEQARRALGEAIAASEPSYKDYTIYMPRIGR